jgi:drug/metabolite transporter (DMT)-like permease
MVVLLSIPLPRQKIGIKSISAITISFGGVFIVSTQGNILVLGFSSPEGTLLVLSSSVIWALFWVYSIRDERDEVGKLFLYFTSRFVFIAISIPLFSEIVIPDVVRLLGATYVGLFEMGVTFVMWSKALKLSKTTAQVSNFIYLVPFLSLIVIHFTVGEEISLSTIVGLIFIVAGIIPQHYDSRRPSAITMKTTT